MKESINELYTKLQLLSSQIQDNKQQKIHSLLWIEYEKCLNEENNDVNSLRDMLQNWAEKNHHDCIISHTIIVTNLFNSISENKKFKMITKNQDKELFDFLELFKESMNILSFFDLTKKNFNLRDYSENNIIVDITNFINYFTTRDDIIEADIIVASKLIAVGCNLCMKINRIDYLTRGIMLPFLSSLYKKGFTQEARNQAETFYLYLKKHDQNHFAFLVHAHLYSFQKTPHLTAINMTFSLIYAIKYDDMSDEYVFEISTIYLRLLRDAKLFNLLEEFYNHYINKSTDDRLILASSLIYIHSLFYTDQDKALTHTIEILNKYRELLFDNEQEAIISWLIVIFNLIKFNQTNEKQFILYMDMFKRVIGEEKYNNLYSMVFPTAITSKLLKNMMPKILNITFDSDIGYDVNNYVMMAKSFIQDAFIQKNFEEIYLCLFYLMSPEFVREYSPKNIKIATMNANKKLLNPSDILQNFENRLHEFTNNLQGEVVILAMTNENMYQITINDTASIFEHKVDSYDIYDWINKNSEILEVKDKDEYELFELALPSDHQENSKRTIDNKTKIKLDINDLSNTITIFRSFNSASFPHNFYKDESGNFLALKRPLSLNFSIDLSYAENLSINNDIGLWAPCESGDMTINMIYSRIEKFHQENNLTFNPVTSIVPKEKIQNDIAVVITHGSSNIDETNRVYFTQDNLQIELTNILKDNKVIILFVCHSGKQSLSDYSYSIDSIVKNLLTNHTKAIIAPCWPLSIDIAYFYYKMFIELLCKNLSLGDIHFEIMKELSKRNINPAVWGNLHYYGNPNIYLT